MKKIMTLAMILLSVAFFSACDLLNPDTPEEDTSPPVIALTGGVSTLEVGGTFTEPTCTVTDNVDTDLTCTKTGEVLVDTVGEYTLTYTAVDSAGNEATPRTFTVTVTAEVIEDTEAPTITVTGGTTMIFAGEEFTEPVCGVTDNMDASVECVVTGTVDSNTAGEYTLTYNATDNAGNVAATKTFTVRVIDMSGSIYRQYYNQVIALDGAVNNLSDDQKRLVINLVNSNDFIDFFGTIVGEYQLLDEEIDLTEDEIATFIDIFDDLVNSLIDYNYFMMQEFFVDDGTFVYLDDTKEVILRYVGSDDEVVIPDTVVTIGYGAFARTDITSVTFSNSVRQISIGAFSDTELTTITIPETIESIGWSSFEATPIESITIEGDASRFDDVWILTGLSFELHPSYVVHEVYGFLESTGTIVQYFGNATDLVIPETINDITVTEIMAATFRYGEIVNLTIPASITTIGYDAFSRNNFESITILGDESRFDDVWLEIGFPMELASFIVETDDGFIFNKTSQEIIVYVGGDTTVVIPSEIDGVAVTSIGQYAFYDVYGTISLTIPESITTIARRSFASYSIEAITILGDSTRFDDEWLDIGFPIELAGFVTVTPDGFTFNTNTGELYLYTGDATTLTIPSQIDGVDVVIIASGAFEKNRTLTSVTIPDTVTIIEERAFASTKGVLTQVYLGSNVEIIGDEAFKGHGITTLTIPASVTDIGDEAFQTTNIIGESITTLTILGDETRFDDEWETIGFPMNLATFIVTTADGYVFNTNTQTIIEYTGTATTLSIPSTIDGVTVIGLGYEVFMEVGLTSVSLPDTLEVIGAAAFVFNNLADITIPASVTDIESYAFYGNPIESITILGDDSRFDDVWENVGFPMNLATFIVTSADGYVFNTNTQTIIDYEGSATIIDIPSQIDGIDVLIIGEEVFEGRTNLTSVTIPDTVIEIKDEAFAGTRGALTELHLGSGVEVIRYRAFDDHGLTSLTIPESVETIYYGAFEPYYTVADSFTTITILGDTSRFDEDWLEIGFPIELANFIITTEDGFVINTINGWLMGYTGTSSSIVIPSVVNDVDIWYIDEYVFANQNIDTITIPESILYIGYGAFADNPITSITILGDQNRFNDNWRHIGFPMELAPFIVTTEDGFVFHTEYHAIIDYVGTATTIIIPDVINDTTVLMIENSAFTSRGLTSVTIPESVVEIEYGAFADNPLTSITILGDSTRFDHIWEYIGFPIELAAFLVTTPEGFVFNTSTETIVGYTGTATTLTIPAEIEGVPVTAIGYSAFEGNRTLTSVTIPDSVHEILFRAFASTKGVLTEVILGNNVEVIDDMAFKGHGITTLVIPESVQYIGYEAFHTTNEIGVSLTSITILGDASRFNDMWEEIGFPMELATFIITTPEGIVFDTTANDIIDYVGESSVLVIPSEINGVVITYIGELIFAYKGLTDITIPETVTIIDYMAFTGNSLESITILGDTSRFDEMWMHIGFPIELAPFIHITDDGIVFHKTLQAIIDYTGNATEIVIPASIDGIAVLSIEDHVFAYNAITSVTIPETVIEIGMNAFANNPLTSITILGDETRFDDVWENIGFPPDLSRIDYQVVQLGDVIITSISESGENDYYQIELTETTTIRVYTESSNDTYGYLYDANFLDLIHNDDAGEGTNFEFSYTLEPGIYYIRVRAYSEFATFDYELHIESDQ
ncbi:leucine-rich repeat protein [Candidatus Xianfuyuplasma coldseepsis]|uniref:Leucine-rich repeat protein n=1 Tax=Candidatus Xianfuyuplasma coldseepsis TaxID=2782163 RepID=A0A7L7KSR6_9MOLU|nr:leucine-rich repeat protein [Xianfuyuplasma coldseepsis]QMS85312.1 leucine-rich repeat protein [Xianfuyuplasma coldseepsis]